MQSEDEGDPSAIRRFLIGPNGHGLWIVRDAEGSCGAVFVNLEDALHFAKAEREALRPAATELRLVAKLDWRSMFAAAGGKVA